MICLGNAKWARRKRRQGELIFDDSKKAGPRVIRPLWCEIVARQGKCTVTRITSEKTGRRVGGGPKTIKLGSMGVNRAPALTVNRCEKPSSLGTQGSALLKNRFDCVGMAGDRKNPKFLCR